jgi:hypothetical protein
MPFSTNLAIAADSNIFPDIGPTIPSAPIFTLLWNSTTRDRVLGPKMPSTASAG